MKPFGNTQEARLNTSRYRYMLQKARTQEEDDMSEFEQAFIKGFDQYQTQGAKALRQEISVTEMMTSEQYQQLQKFQQMASDLLAVIDEAFPEKKGVAAPIALRELLSILPRSQALGLSKFRSALRLVAKHGFVESVEPN
ncbi:hypothetical protein A4G20_05520 [Pasteurellaceae bacterium RH1A]|nr:hypothetical protein A4G20_05520 [Pasteurellaceae bacterium RH1A]